MEKIRSQKNDSALPLADKRREYITVWMTLAEKAAAVENARRAALPMSSFSRKVLLESVVPQAAAPSPDWMKAYAQTARWSGLLNQIAHALNSASLQGLLQPAISSRCSDLEYVISEMALDVDELREKILQMAG